MFRAKFVFPIVAVALNVVACSQLALAQSQSDNHRAKPLEAGAEIVVVTLNDLRDVDTDLRHLQTAANHLYEEVTTQRVTLQTVPNLIAPGTIVNLPVGTQATGDVIPARPARVDAAMSEIRPVATLLKSDVDAFLNGEKQLVLPEDTKEELSEELRQWVISVDNIYDQCRILEPLTAAAPYYNQGAIAQAAWAIDQDVKELERIRRLMYRALQREGKRQAREKQQR
jgi:hypothetical protein